MGWGPAPLHPFVWRSVVRQTSWGHMAPPSVSIFTVVFFFFAALGSSTDQLLQLHAGPVVCPSEVPSPWTLLLLSKILLRLGGC